MMYPYGVYVASTDRRTRNRYLKGKETISPYSLQLYLELYLEMHDMEMVEHCLDKLKVPKDTMTLQERIVFYNMFVKK